MGIEESKVNMGSSPCEVSLPQIPSSMPWRVLHQCTYDQWMRGHSEAANFSDRIMTCTSQLHGDCSQTFCINKQTIISVKRSQPIFSFRKRCRFTKMAEHFEYNHIPAQLSSIQNFHFKSVLCYQGDLVVLHLTRNKVTQFGLVDLQINKFLGVFGKQTVDFPVDTVLGEISPDGTYCLIQIPSTRNNRLYVFQWYDLRSRVLLHELGLPSGQALFCFDPRFTSARIAVSNFERNSVNSVSLVNTITWERLISNNHIISRLSTLQPCLRRLNFARAGHLLLAVCSEVEGCRCASRGRRASWPTHCHLLLFNSDTLQRLRNIRFDRYVCTLHACPVNYSVVFSRCGSRIAVVTNVADLPNCDFVTVYQLPPPLSLQAIVREKILQLYSEEELFAMGLPHRIIDYLRFRPSFTCAGSCISRSSSIAARAFAEP